MNLCLVVGATHGYTGDAPPLLKSGRACASHFNVLNALDKVVVTRTDDEPVLDDHRGLQVVPNTFYPRASKGTLKPSGLMIGFEPYWAYKHAWRGAGYYLSER